MTHTSQRSTVVGVFNERDDAREAIEALKDDGFAADTISILSPDKRTTESMAEETGTHAGSGAATGADRIPVRVEGADWDRDSGLKAEPVRPLTGQVPGDLL